MQQSIHDTDMAYIDTCTIVIDIFYSSFVAGIDLPHQGVVDSYISQFLVSAAYGTSS